MGLRHSEPVPTTNTDILLENVGGKMRMTAPNGDTVVVKIEADDADFGEVGSISLVARSGISIPFDPEKHAGYAFEVVEAGDSMVPPVGNMEPLSPYGDLLGEPFRFPAAAVNVVNEAGGYSSAALLANALTVPSDSFQVFGHDGKTQIGTATLDTVTEGGQLISADLILDGPAQAVMFSDGLEDCTFMPIVD